MSKNYWPEVEVSPFVKTPLSGLYGGGRGTDVYVHIFVISPKGNFVLKGMHGVVFDYMKKHYPVNIHSQLWFRKGRINKVQKIGWRCQGKEMLIREGRDVSRTKGGADRVFNQHLSNRPRYEVRFRAKNAATDFVYMTFRNFPKKWLPIYDQAFDELP